MIMELVKNRELCSHNQQRQIRQVASSEKWLLTWISLWAHFFIAYDLPSLVSEKYAYADYLTFLHTSNNWKSVEEITSKGINTLLEYFPGLEKIHSF